jgi:hypothetical protein
MDKNLGWLALGLFAVVAACGGQSQGSSAVTSNASPSQKPATTAGWTTYHEPAWGYAIGMPAGWHPVTAAETDPQQFRHFSSVNVTDAKTLEGLGANGMLLTIIVGNVNSGCPGDQPPVGWAQSTVPAVAVKIDGVDGVVSGAQSQDLKSWASQVVVAKGKYCYSFIGVTNSHTAQLTWTPVFEQMLGTFSFGTPIAPPF